MLKIKKSQLDAKPMGLHSVENLPDALNKSAALLMSIAKTIKETVETGIYDGVQPGLEMAIREMQYIDQMVEEHYSDQLGDEYIKGRSLHDRSSPDSNYLLNSQFHNPGENL